MRKIEQIADHAGETVGFLVDGLQEFDTGGWLPFDRGIEHGAHRGFDGRQGSAQIVRNRGEQGGFQLVGLREHISARGFVGETHALQGQGSLVGETAEQCAIVFVETSAFRSPAHFEHADLAFRGVDWEVDDVFTCGGLGGACAESVRRHDSRAAGGESGGLPGDQGLQGDCFLVAGQRSSGSGWERGDALQPVAVLPGQDVRLGGAVDLDHMAHDGIENVIEGATGDQSLVQLIEELGASFLLFGVASALAPGNDEVRPHQRDRQEDNQGEHVIGAGDLEGVVWR
ncbi:MAG: hypothetical protein QM692_00860 [Thermomicrobiales bacterium]